jgi:uncharacterized protein (TIGR00369 family)
MDIITHQAINPELCGRALQVEKGFSRVALVTTAVMAADHTGLIHGGFIFGLADYAAMIAVNHPNVVLGAADVKFLKPVVQGETVIAEARVEEIQGKKALGRGIGGKPVGNRFPRACLPVLPWTNMFFSQPP